MSHLEDVKGTKTFDWTTDDVSNYPLITKNDAEFLKRVITNAFEGFPQGKLIVNADLLREQQNVYVEGNIVVAFKHRGKMYILSRSVLQKEDATRNLSMEEGAVSLVVGSVTLEDKDDVQKILSGVLSEHILHQYI